MEIENVAHYRFLIGNFKAIIIGDGQAFFPAYPLYAPNASAQEVMQTLENHFLDTQNYLLQCNVLFIDNGKNKILIDTGAGTGLSNSLGQLLNNLKTIGINAGEISDILITHCHIDHISGLRNHKSQLNFPHAKIWIQEKEWDFWRKNNLDLSSMAIEKPFQEAFIQATHFHLKSFENQIHTFKYNTEVLPGIIAIDAVGHSPGHTAFRISSGSESLLHAGDIFHHPAFDLEHPTWATAFDQDAKQAYKTRLKLLDQSVLERSLLMAYHMPFPALGHVRKKGNGYDWESIAWKF